MCRAVFPIAAADTTVLVRVLGHTLFPLWFSNVFQAVCCIGAARVHGADRRTRTCAASRGPLPSGRGAPWNGPPPRAPGMARSARIRPRDLHFPLVFLFKVFSLTAGQTKIA